MLKSIGVIINQEFTLMTVHHQFQIGAGKVVPFTARKQSLTIAVPSELERCDIFPFEVCGDSFIDEDIRDGDCLVARRKFALSEVISGRLCVVRVAGTDEVLKRVHVIDENLVRLCSANTNYPDLIYNIEMVEILALVVGKWQPLK
jgi:SOS-response transcriptional repressor LexA